VYQSWRETSQCLFAGEIDESNLKLKRNIEDSEDSDEEREVHVSKKRK
jgi:hypothetical protein